MRKLTPKSVLITFLVVGDVIITAFVWFGLQTPTLNNKGYGLLELFIPTALILAATTCFFIRKVNRMSEEQMKEVLNG